MKPDSSMPDLTGVLAKYLAPRFLEPNQTVPTSVNVSAAKKVANVDDVSANVFIRGTSCVDRSKSNSVDLRIQEIVCRQRL